MVTPHQHLRAQVHTPSMPPGFMPGSMGGGMVTPLQYNLMQMGLRPPPGTGGPMMMGGSGGFAPGMMPPEGMMPPAEGGGPPQSFGRNDTARHIMAEWRARRAARTGQPPAVGGLPRHDEQSDGAAPAAQVSSSSAAAAGVLASLQVDEIDGEEVASASAHAPRPPRAALPSRRPPNM